MWVMPRSAVSSSGLPYWKSTYSEGLSVHSDRLQRRPVRPLLECKRGLGSKRKIYEFPLGYVSTI